MPLSYVKENAMYSRIGETANTVGGEDRKDAEGTEDTDAERGAGGRSNAGDTGKGLHMLALSTCADDMTDNRRMVFCYMTGRRKHR